MNRPKCGSAGVAWRYSGGMVTVGILGGMGPAATGQFLIDLTAATPAQVDQDHLHAIIDSDPSIPDRTTAILAGDDAPAAPIRRGLDRLVEWGADLLAVPCNTAHVFIDQFADELPVPLVHIVEATLDEAERRSPGGAWLTGTIGTMRTGLYQRAAERRGYVLHEPPMALQERIMGVIGAVKAGNLNEAGAEFRRVAEELRAVRELPIVMACTEIPLAFSRSGLERAVAVSSLEALAKATYKKAQSMRLGGS